MQLDGNSYPLSHGVTVVGRGSECDVRIVDAAASRKHLEIVWHGKSGVLRDLGSTNGSKINGQRFRETKLRPDTVVYIGKTALRFRFSPVIGAKADSLGA
nr:FHA domain-containing protein [Canibacter zhuwentaonis]